MTLLRWASALLALAVLVLSTGLLTSCADDEGLREGSGELDIEDASAPETSQPSGAGTPPRRSAAITRLVCDSPLFWGKQAFDASGALLGDAPPTGAHPEPRAAADISVLAEQPGLTDYLLVTETVDGPVAEYDYLVSGQTVGVVTVVQRADGAWDFAEGLLCEAEAAIVPPELDAMRRALTAVPGVELPIAKCVTERGIAEFGPEAWPQIAAGDGSDETHERLLVLVEECRP